MNKEGTLALYKKGREAWNVWAKEMLGRQDKLMETEEWLPGKGAQNAATQSWFTAARSDFSGQNFEDEADFSNFEFPGEVDFTEVKFAKQALFREAKFNGDAEFRNTTFSSDADFWNATFSGEARFENATFSDYAKFMRAKFSKAGFAEAVFNGDTLFENAKFSSDAVFEAATFSGYIVFENAKFDGAGEFLNATFSGDANFKRAKFGGYARFGNAAFSGNAGFEEAKFSDNVWFDEATFSKPAKFEKVMFYSNAGFYKTKFSDNVGFDEAMFCGNAGFYQVIFESIADFSGTTFRKEANFVAIKGQSFFTLKNVRFLSVPDFEQANFAEAPRLDHLSVQALGNEPDIAARWRALRRLATQGHDYQRELNFLADEIKSLRGVEDKKWPCPTNLFKGKKIWPGAGRYWAGLFYQRLSDFGRSAFRPLLWWMSATAVFWLYYLSAHLEFSGWDSIEILSTIPPLTCVSETSSSPLMAALYLSVNNGLVISGLSRSEKLMQSYVCLYGKNELGPIMPDVVVFAGITQTIFSAVLIFLFLLALRNYFRIK
ncbi:Uncharacterized protein YjbI, contains pentapeptide repeats [Nitrosospira multiformis]|uniref:Uncharacterized protein YjbI, contains pentapeptide repeats n=1 Tax=Nitrosospira multiformis TaxID=1231 RepID=A0A1H8ML15_9PROT|nr:pentapeptide repeat-containing protein [Nitrosospira multiformis]SEO18075.1 Uncharacterized protein YjbI, contains pentapeptide repeats [Nitrosospira multiformis]